MAIPLPTFAEISELIKKGATLEAQEKIMNLREEILNLPEENQDLRQKVKELRDSLAFKKTLTFRSPFYYAEGDEAPFCPNCWESDHLAVHLTRYRGAEGIDHACTKCRTRWRSDGCPYRQGTF